MFYYWIILLLLLLLLLLRYAFFIWLIYFNIIGWNESIYQSEHEWNGYLIIMFDIVKKERTFHSIYMFSITKHWCNKIKKIQL